MLFYPPPPSVFSIDMYITVRRCLGSTPWPASSHQELGSYLFLRLDLSSFMSFQAYVLSCIKIKCSLPQTPSFNLYNMLSYCNVCSRVTQYLKFLFISILLIPFETAHYVVLSVVILHLDCQLPNNDTETYF